MNKSDRRPETDDGQVSRLRKLSDAASVFLLVLVVLCLAASEARAVVGSTEPESIPKPLTGYRLPELTLAELEALILASSPVDRIQRSGGKVQVGTDGGVTITNPNATVTRFTRSVVFDGIAAPSVAPAGKGKFYYDSATNKFLFSSNTGAYVPLGGTVTATAGALADNAVVLGAGGTDTKVAAGIITNGVSSLTLGQAGVSQGQISFANLTSGSVSLRPVTGALGLSILSLPAATDTLVGKATTDTLTNKTLTSPAISTPTGIVKGDVGLGNVDNTSDATKNSAVATLTSKTLTTPIFTSYTVATLPAAGTAGRLAVVTDAATAGSCTSGGGSALAYCRDSGAAWVPLGDGGGGGTPGGSDTQVQRNNAGAFGGITNATSDGTTLSLTSPKVITGINDTNGNELVKVTATASAVNEITVANAATANAPTISATGEDINIDIKMVPKGSGGLRVGADSIFTNDVWSFGASGVTQELKMRDRGIGTVATVFQNGFSEVVVGRTDAPVTIAGTSLISPLFRSNSAKVLLQGTGATQLATTQTTAPTCTTNCGTSPSVVGSDTFMRVTMGATGTPASGWVVTFNGTWAAAPVCTVQMAKAGMAVGKQALTVVTTTTTLTVVTNGTAPATTDVYAITCGGVQ